MKALLPLAFAGALLAGTALAAGNQSSGWSGQNSSASQNGAQTGHWKAGDVKQIQSKLKQQGYDVGQVDGRLGRSTQQALRQFQEDKGIQATGRPDQQTLAALDVTPNGTQQGQMPADTNQNTNRGTSAPTMGPQDNSGATETPQTPGPAGQQR